MVELVCPSEKSLTLLAKGQLHGDEAKVVRAHAVGCPKCSLYLVGSGDTAAAPPAQVNCPPEQSLVALAKGQILGDAAADLRAHAQSCPKCSLYLMGQSDTAGAMLADANCPSEKVLTDVVKGTLRGGVADTVRSHAQSCPKCSVYLLGHSRTAAGPPSLESCPPQQSLTDVVKGTLRGGAADDIRTHAQSCPKCSLYLMSQGQTAAGLPEGEACPPEATLVQLAGGHIKGPAAAEVRTHTDKCPKCSVFLSALGDSNGDVAQAHALAESVFASDQPARYVAEFRLVRALGQGAMGQVFLAHDTFLDRLVAVKFLTASESTPAARERFFVEARAVARLQHPNVVTLYRAGEENGKRYLVSEYVRGQSLERLKKPLPWQKALDIGLGLARGLATAHGRGVLHRDIKPANTMMTETGEVKILDFGLAKLVSSHPDSDPAAATDAAQVATPVDAQQVSSLALTRTGSLLGTPLYMAPEIWLGQVATARTDVFSLGAMLYELCSGKPPHDAETVPALRDLILDKDAKPLLQVAPAVNPRLAAVIDRCLRRNPLDRFASGLELRDALEAIAAKAPFLSRRVVAVAASLVLVLFASLGGVAVMRDRQAKRQAVLAQQLGQEIKDMEWTLRSARQLPLHDLNREKEIVRGRMAQLEGKMRSYGSLGQALSHYALGRGHLALHEYPQALTQLQQAIALGYQGADAQYALGLVLGLHYQAAKAELVDAGPPSWVKKRIQPLEARYLQPALQALQRSRQMQHDAPQYLEGLISFYQGDYDAALQHAQAALQAAPWLYEAQVLMGDVYFDRGEYGRAQQSSKEFDELYAKAIDSYTRAAAIGQSDAEIYGKLAAAWIPRLNAALSLGTPMDKAHAAAMQAADQALVAEPTNVLARLKRSQAGRWLYSTTLGGNATTAERLKECLQGADSILRAQPDHAPALQFAASCHMVLSEHARVTGVDRGPMLRHAIELLERLLAKDPEHYNAAQDLSCAFAQMVEHLAVHGDPEAKVFAEKGLAFILKAAALDRESYQPQLWALAIRRLQVMGAPSLPEVQGLLTRLDADYAPIAKLNARDGYALAFHMAPYAIAAYRVSLAGLDYQPLLKRAQEELDAVHALGTNMEDAEQHALLVHYVAARAQVAQHKDPAPFLAAMEEDRKRCLAVEPNDAPCMANAVLGEWVEADWKAQNKQPFLPILRRALEHAMAAAQRPEKLVMPWRILAETHLRLARTEETAAARRRHVDEGLAAVQQLFAIYPKHPSGLAAQGALTLLRAGDERDAGRRLTAVREALGFLEAAQAGDALLDEGYVASLGEARTVARGAGG